MVITNLNFHFKDKSEEQINRRGIINISEGKQQRKNLVIGLN